MIKQNLSDGDLAIAPPISMHSIRPGHDFYFNTYAPKVRSCGIVANERYYAWLQAACFDSLGSSAVADAIEAVGLAGLGNVSKAPQISCQAYEVYCRARKKLDALLEDPNKRPEDKTLLVLITLCFFQVHVRGS
jgi:hypothetical protein